MKKAFIDFSPCRSSCCGMNLPKVIADDVTCLNFYDCYLSDLRLYENSTCHLFDSSGHIFLGDQSILFIHSAAGNLQVSIKSPDCRIVMYNPVKVNFVNEHDYDLSVIITKVGFCDV